MSPYQFEGAGKIAPPNVADRYTALSKHLRPVKHADFTYAGE